MTAKTMKAVKLKKYNPYDCDLSKYYYDPVAGQVAVDFIEGYITHVKGELGGKPFLLLNWEKEKLDLDAAYSSYDESFAYELNKEVKAEYDPNIKECSRGIHFFLTFDEAKDY